MSSRDSFYACMHAKSLQSCPTLCDPMDCGPSGSSVHGILQAKTLDWVAISFSYSLINQLTLGKNILQHSARS